MIKITPVRVVFLLLLVGLICLPAAPLNALDKGHWLLARTIPIHHSTHIAAFVDTTWGITGGYEGDIRHTPDGGETWIKARSTNCRCRWGLDIVNQDLIWSVGEIGVVRFSTDMGLTWQSAADPPSGDYAHYVSFFDEANGWLGTSTKVWSTTDSAKSWSLMKTPESTRNLIGAVNALSASEGLLLTFTGKLYYTRDAGETWQVRPLALAEDRRIDLNVLPAMRFQNAQDGVVVIQLRSGEIISLSTLDGGSTWSESDVPVEASGGRLYLSHDSTTLTVLAQVTRDDADNTIFVLRYVE